MDSYEMAHEIYGTAHDLEGNRWILNTNWHNFWHLNMIPSDTLHVARRKRISQTLCVASPAPGYPLAPFLLLSILPHPAERIYSKCEDRRQASVRQA